MYIGRSSDFRCGFVCPQSFAALHQRRQPQSRDSVVAKPLVRNFVDAIPHSRRYTCRVCTFRSSPDNYEISRCVSPFVFFPNNEVYIANGASAIPTNGLALLLLHMVHVQRANCVVFLVIATNMTTDDQSFRKEIQRLFFRRLRYDLASELKNWILLVESKGLRQSSLAYPGFEQTYT